MVLLDTETPGTSREIYSVDAEGSISQSLDYKPSALAIELYNSKLLLVISLVYPIGALHHYIFIISQL